ncbi:MAG TPA: arsenite methyltransferase [Acidimicrobiia bacterium]|nr:arsenite methyltransferase [Acidimicrobiia bacterium]
MPETEIREKVRRRYAAAAVGTDNGCCGADSCGPLSADAGSPLYDETELELIPAEAAAASLGCGNPMAVADLAEGEVVLDLGSGGGIDVLLSARRVGPSGFAYGLDMTDEMLDLARRNAAEGGAGNVEFLRGYIEDIPLQDATVDVVISNCVINLSADKQAVFDEIQRVLRPGGRIGITDIVADDHLDPDQIAERGSWVGCIAGALTFTEYRQGLSEAGLEDVTIAPTHAVADGMWSVTVRAKKPRIT